jgi:methylmalonyl-CoA mutase N-terminal domain/subunit
MTEQFTRSKIPIKPVYTPKDSESLDYEKKLGAPGDYPYTRGIRPAGAWTWIQRELSGEGDPKTSNKQLKHLISRGQTGIDVIGDAPSMGLLDPDHPLAINAVGTQGVSICCLQDFRDLWKDLPLDSITISSSIPAIFTVAALFLVAQENKVPTENLRGSVIQAPFFMEDCGYAVHMPFDLRLRHMPFDLRLRMASDSIAFCTDKMPKFHSFLEDTYFFSEAGLNGIEEMALGFIEIRHVVRDLLKRGLDIDSFAPRIAILVNCSMDIFEEIAKIRATRRLFARMMKEEFGARDRRSQAPVITCHTSGLSLTAQQPFNNIVRGAIQSLALVMAGVQALEISAFDEAYRTPSPESHLVGLRTQQIVGLETNITKVADPLGGSYYIEALTDEIEDRIRDMIADIESKGDPAELSDKGFFKKFFDDVMARYAGQIADGELPKVGLNCHQIAEEDDTLLKEVAETKIEPCWDHVDKIRDYKKNRDLEKIKSVLRQCLQSAKTDDQNLTHSIINAFEAGATIGEISGALRMAYNYPYDPHDMIDPMI